MIRPIWCALLSLGLAAGLGTACALPGRGARTALADTTHVDTTQRDSAVAAPTQTPVTSEDIERTPSEPVENLLMARFPGVEVSRSRSGALMIRIRGTTTLLGSNEPLYVLDGVPILSGPDGGLTGINPYDIESIEVLKDPASTAMYGVRGANGVILIKTKRPGQ